MINKIRSRLDYGNKSLDLHLKKEENIDDIYQKYVILKLSVFDNFRCTT